MTAVAPTTRTRRPEVGRVTTRWRRAVGVLLVVHAVAHLAGTTQALGAIADDGAVEVVGGLAELDATSALVAWAATWALLAGLTGLSAVRTLLGRPSARSSVVVAAAASLVACVVGLWPTALGVVVNGGLLVASRQPIWSTR